MDIPLFHGVRRFFRCPLVRINGMDLQKGLVMSKAVETQLSTPLTLEKLHLEVPDVAPVHLQTLDLARHVVGNPEGKRYVVATFDATRMGQKYVTAVYPQQGNYLTLIRLLVCEFDAELREDATQRHIALIQAIQQGTLKTYLRENQ
jgi:hypothetical protein